MLHDNQQKLYYTATELLERGVKEIPMLWKPFFPQTGLMGFTGSSDVGKSTFLRQLATSICKRDTSFLGYPLNVRHGNVIYISTEDGADAVSMSLTKQLGGLDPHCVNGLKFVLNQGDPQIAVKSILATEKVDLIIIDAWTDLYIGNPNDPIQVRKSLKALTTLAEKHHCAVIILHHTTKNSEYHKPDKNRLNGSQGIEAKLRVLLELRQGQDGEKLMTVLKGNYIPDRIKKESIVFSFDEEKLLFNETGKSIDKCLPLSQQRCSFANDKNLANKIRHMKDVENLTFEAIFGKLSKELGEGNCPALTTIKNIYYSVSRSAA